MRRKRTSLRRWKARCRIGRHITALMIVEHSLARWFEFIPVDCNCDVYVARRV